MNLCEVENRIINTYVSLERTIVSYRTYYTIVPSQNYRTILTIVYYGIPTIEQNRNNTDNNFS